MRKLVRFIGGPQDGYVCECLTDTVNYYDYNGDRIARYIVHKLAGERDSFYFAAPEGMSIDEAIRQLLYR